MEAETRSPVFSGFSEALQGLPTIRAYAGARERFMALHLERVDRNSRLYFSFNMAARWLSLRLDALAMLTLMSVSALAVLLKNSVDPVMAGLALIYCLNITGFLQWTIRLSVDMENALTAVQRVLNFAKIEPEAPYIMPEKQQQEQEKEKEEVSPPMHTRNFSG